MYKRLILFILLLTSVSVYAQQHTLRNVITENTFEDSVLFYLRQPTFKAEVSKLVSVDKPFTVDYVLRNGKCRQIILGTSEDVEVISDDPQRTVNYRPLTPPLGNNPEIIRCVFSVEMKAKHAGNIEIPSASVDPDVETGYPGGGISINSSMVVMPGELSAAPKHPTKATSKPKTRTTPKSETKQNPDKNGWIDIK